MAVDLAVFAFGNNLRIPCSAARACRDECGRYATWLSDSVSRSIWTKFTTVARLIVVLWIQPDLEPADSLELEQDLGQNLDFGWERGLDLVTLLGSGLGSLRGLGSPLDLDRLPDFDLL